MSSKGKRKAKKVIDEVASSNAQACAAEYQARYGSIDSIGFKRAWLEARDLDPKLPEAPPDNLPDEVQRAVILLARRVLTLESEWS